MLTAMLPPNRCALIGMVHLLPLPGSPGWNRDPAAVRQRALSDARALVDNGCDAILLENMGDAPYLNGHIEPAALALASVIAADLAQLPVPLGVQLLAAANTHALAAALASGAQFIRVEGFAYGHLADEGWIDACAGPLLRRRAELGAQHIQIWADVQKKHAAHAATADLSLEELAHGYAFCGADALILTGTRTGAPTDPEHLRRAAHAGLPLIVGSGVTPHDAPTLAPHARGLIVGSYLKHDGDWRNPVDPQRVRALRDALR